MYNFSAYAQKRKMSTKCPNRPFINVTKPKSYKCEVCLNFFPANRASQCTRELTREKSRSRAPPATKSSPPKAPCGTTRRPTARRECLSARFVTRKTKNDVGRHMVYHGNQKHSCVKCNKKFYTSSSLRLHEKRNKC